MSFRLCGVFTLVAALFLLFAISAGPQDVAAGVHREPAAQEAVFPGPVPTSHPQKALPLETTSTRNVSQSTGLGGVRLLTFNPLYSWYGWTNQLISYAAALRYAMEDNRAVLFPAEGMPAPFYQLFDLNATRDNLRGLVSIVEPKDVPRRLFPPTSMNKRGLFLPLREFYRSAHAAIAQRYLRTLYSRAAPYAFVRHHNFFMRFPWAASMEPHGEAFFMNALSPAKVVWAAYHELMERIREKAAAHPNPNKRASGGRSTTTVVAVHIRMENDASLLRPRGAKSPSAEEYLRFFESLRKLVAPSSVGGPAVVMYLCSGEPLPPSGLAAANNFSQSTNVPVIFRDSLKSSLRVTLPRAIGEQREAHRTKARTTQDHYLSAVEYLVLSHADVAVMPSYSSFRYAVFARRCYPTPRVGSASTPSSGVMVHIRRISVGGIQRPCYGGLCASGGRGTSPTHPGSRFSLGAA